MRSPRRSSNVQSFSTPHSRRAEDGNAVSGILPESTAQSSDGPSPFPKSFSRPAGPDRVTFSFPGRRRRTSRPSQTNAISDCPKRTVGLHPEPSVSIYDNTDSIEGTLPTSFAHFEPRHGLKAGEGLPVALQGIEQRSCRHRCQGSLRFFGKAGEKEKDGDWDDKPGDLHFLSFFLGFTSFSNSSGFPNPAALNRSRSFSFLGSSFKDLSHCSLALSFSDSFRKISP